MHIIVVDDSAPFRIAMRALLGEAGYSDVTIISSGQELLRMIGRGEDEERSLGDADLILLDMLMPQMDGIETLRALKNHPAYENVPVLMVSGQDEESMIESAFDAGAMDYLSKPIKKLELRARIRSSLRLKHEIDRRKAREDDLVVLNSFLKEANDELRGLSHTDSVTRVANRRYFEENLHREWNRAAREAQPMAVVMIDIDHFKTYNDYYGHVAGDKCLMQIARTLANVIKRSSDLFARYGGEEFVALLVNTSLEGAAAVAEAMRANVEHLALPHAERCSSPYLTISAGISCAVPGKRGKPWGLVEAADEALYRAKRAGRNQVALHHSTTHEPSIPSMPSFGSLAPERPE